jgi:hypothetical protein
VLFALIAAMGDVCSIGFWPTATTAGLTALCGLTALRGLTAMSGLTALSVLTALSTNGL